MSNHIVIGSNFGDEGKGLVTNYLAKDLANSIVVRFNGGAQAGHTVELEDGRRHEFHSIGSGTLQGSDTFLSEHFIANPPIFNQEYIEVPENNFRVFAHRKALLTTPYDWLLNQSAEEVRGAGRHGTCGMGINETVTRMAGGYDGTIPSDKLRAINWDTRVEDIFDMGRLKHRLKIIRDIYVPKRAKQRGIEDYTYIQEYDISDYLESCDLMSRLVIPVGNYNILNMYAHRIFEGAQGLLLDEYHEFYPHVTRSRTGIINASSILKSLGEKKADVHYVTRSYLTRHGEGPLPYAGDIPSKVDVTNRTNKNQGELRFAPLNLPLLKKSITNDLLDSNGLILKPSLKVTWGNHTDDTVGAKDKVYGQGLSRELFKILPHMNQTCFYSKFGEVS